MQKTKSAHESKTNKILWDFEIQTDHPIPARRPDLVLKDYCHLVDFAVPVDHRFKMKQSKNINKYLYLAEELKKLWNLKVTVILIIGGVLGTASKKLKMRLA